jgi:hypothetical protein
VLALALLAQLAETLSNHGDQLAAMAVALVKF